MRKASMLLLVLFAFGAWALAQTSTQIQITHGPVVEQVTPNSAIVAWTTNVPSSAILHYTTDPNHWSQVAEQAWGGQQSKTGTTHRVHVTGLQPNTLYYLQAESGDPKGGSGGSVKSPSSPVQLHTPPAGSAPVAYPNGR